MDTDKTYIKINNEITIKYVNENKYLTGILIEKNSSAEYLLCHNKWNSTDVEVYIDNDLIDDIQIYPFNVTNEYLMKNITWTIDKLDDYYNHRFRYNNKIVLPIENLLYNSIKIKDNIEHLTKKFNILYSKKLCYFANIYHITALYDKDTLEIICHEYDD